MLAPETQNANAHQKYDTIHGGRLNEADKIAVAQCHREYRPAHYVSVMLTTR